MPLRELFNIIVAVLLGFLIVWAVAWAFDLEVTPAPMPTRSACTQVSTEYTYCHGR